jgi:SAM-dependent methyltransferase
VRVDLPAAKRMMNIVVASHFGSRPLTILEAGGGSKTSLRTDDLNVSAITTIDISPEQLERNQYAARKIQGDLETYRYADTYDIVIVQDVLEHLARADLAIENLADACAGNGLLVVGGPYPASLKGFVTRVTPHWFHVLFYRRVLKYPNAGQPGRPPFPTHFHPFASPETLTPVITGKGFECVYLAYYSGSTQTMINQRSSLFALATRALYAAVNAVTPKSYDTRNCDFYAIFRRA